MNKLAALLAAGMLLSGCVYNSKVSTGAEQLQHHRFVLTSVNGQAVNAGDRPLELSFGEKMAITTIGKMLREGAQVDLTENQLTLATADQTLVYKLADLMH